MKTNYFYLALASTAMLASCSSELDAPKTGDGESLVTFTAQLPGGLSRAFGEGTSAKNLKYAVYLAGETTPLAVHGNDTSLFGSATIPEGTLSANVQMSLAQGKSYDIVFWADANNSPYYFDAENGTIIANYEGVTSSSETLDAFYGKETITVSGAMSQTAILKRPFAQLNIGTSDWAAAKNAGFEVSQASVSVTGVNNTLNMLTGLVDGETVNVTYSIGDIAAKNANAGDFPAGADYTYLAMNYVLVGSEGATTDVTLNVTDGVHTESSTYTAVPVKANYRTNIYGALLTNAVDYNVTIDALFAGESNPVRVNDEASFMDALTNNVDENGNVTIILDDNVTLSGGLVIGSSSRANAANNVEISLGGKTLETYGINVCGDASLTILDGTVSVKGLASGFSAGIKMSDTSRLNMNGVTFTTDLSYLNYGIGILDQCDVTIKNSKILGANTISVAISTNANGVKDGDASVVMLLDNVEVDARDTAFLCNVPANVTVRNSSFKSFLQAGMLRGGNYSFEGDNYFTIVPARGTTLASYDYWQRLYRGKNWVSNGNHVPSSPLTVGNNTPSDQSYRYATNINIADGANVYVAVEGASDEDKKFPNAVFGANPENGFGVYINKLPEVKNSVSGLNYVFVTKNIFINGNEHDVYDPAISSNWAPTASNDDVTLVSSAEQFHIFRDAVNSGKNFAGETVILGADINLGNDEWTPVGPSVQNNFRGTFDGQGHKISNARITKFQKYGNAIFQMTSNARFLNVTFDNIYVENAEADHKNSGNVYSVAVAYAQKDSYFENVHVTNSHVRGFGKIGAILGLAYDPNVSLTMKNCSVTNTTLQGTYNIGGLVGLLERNVNMTVENCKVDDTVNFILNENKNYGEITINGKTSDYWLYTNDSRYVAKSRYYGVSLGYYNTDKDNKFGEVIDGVAYDGYAVNDLN